ncbi:hypothetical protein LPJ64_001218 [Coemansia asiatica]|uniref:Uncharacterized protein n=1 Tax=Coemansia asiatica TaxID=1052880 RepID=A0A9W7XNX0_9FUNG|nr:hypothetical protein LPJ64_001218 [Coemansia asiatica]
MHAHYLCTRALAIARRQTAGNSSHRLFHTTRSIQSIPGSDMNNPTLRKIQSSPRVMAAMSQSMQLLQRKGFVDTHNPKPPSFMKLMQMMSDAEIKKSFLDLQAMLKEEGISFSPADLSAFMNFGGMNADDIKLKEQVEIEDKDNRGMEGEGLLGRISSKFKNRS